MPQYNWMDTSEFEIQVRNRINQRLIENGMEGFPITFSGALREIAKDNRTILEARQTEPARTIKDALESVDKIIAQAVALAKADKRSKVNETDFVRSINAQFCKIWPFCK